MADISKKDNDTITIATGDNIFRKFGFNDKEAEILNIKSQLIIAFEEYINNSSVLNHNIMKEKDMIEMSIEEIIDIICEHTNGDIVAHFEIKR